MRDFGALVIIFFHAQVTGFSSSFIVLDMFFVLSGFVVTNVVLAEVDGRGGLQLGAYYARRVRRLLPAAVTTIAVTCALFVLLASQPERLPLVRQAQAALLYLANWKFIQDDADYFAGDIRESPFMHFWSLSVEEQYYIFFPLLVLAWLRWGKGRPKVLLVVVSALMVASTLAQVVWGRIDPMRAYFGTDTRLFQLLAGVAIAIALREYAHSRGADGAVTWPLAGRVLAIVGAAGFLVFGSELLPMTVSTRNVLATAISAALMVGVYTAPTTAVARFLAHDHMAYLGKISYGIYLWHWPVIVVLERLLDVPPVLVALMALPLTVGLAAVSYRFLESPIRTGRRLNPYPWQTVVTGVSVSVVVALVVVGPVLGTARPPAVAMAERPAEGMAVSERAQDRSQVARQLAAAVPRGIDYPEVAKDRGPGWRMCADDRVEDCVLVDGEGQHVVLVGDSHARMLGAALSSLAEERGFKLSASTVAACPWPDGLVSTRAKVRNRERCRDARQGFYSRTLPQMEADVVVLVNAPRTHHSWEESLVGYDGEPRKMPGAFQRAVERTVDRIGEAGARAVIVTSIMGTEGWGVGEVDPLDCLARARTQADCVVVPPLDKPRADSYYEVAAGTRSGVGTVDLNPTVCPDHPTCLPIVDGEVVWRDSDHVTAGYLDAQREEIWDALVGTGFFRSP